MRQTYSEEDKPELIKNIQRLYKENNKVPTLKSVSNPCGSIYRKIFGSWTAALEEAGFKYIKQSSTITNICLECKTEFTTTTYKEFMFCSTFCSNTSRRKDGWKPTESRDKWKKKLEKKSHDYLWNAPFDKLGWDHKRKRVIGEQKNTCNNCKLDSWMDKPLILEIDHIDGNNKNDVRDNLEGLCPNCHSLTETWRGRNKQNNKDKVTDEELCLALKEAKNIRQALLLVGMAAKGKNYVRAKRLKESLND